MKKLTSISNSFLFFILVCVFFTKITLYILIAQDVLFLKLGGGSDAEYYHGYALGYYDVIVNSWPVILRLLDDISLYSRNNISYILFSLNLIAIPIIVANLSGLSFRVNQKRYLYVLVLCSIYPTIFYYTFDIYRDVFMVFSFLVGCLVVNRFLDTSNIVFFIFYFFISVLIGVFLVSLREYLGYAFLTSLFLWRIKFTKKRIAVFCLLYFLFLFAANYAGILSALTEYRAGFEDNTGGSTLGLDFSNPIMFIPNFVLSALGQLFGLYITNPFAIILLLTETVPFFFMFVYVFYVLIYFFYIALYVPICFLYVSIWFYLFVYVS